MDFNLGILSYLKLSLQRSCKCLTSLFCPKASRKPMRKNKYMSLYTSLSGEALFDPSSSPEKLKRISRDTCRDY